MIAALLVFLVALAPLGWLFTRLRHDAAARDSERLTELSNATRKALATEGIRHQRLMQTWRSRLVANGTPPDATAWANVFEGPESLRLGRFRTVGYARWEDGDRLIARFCKSYHAEEEIPPGTDLNAIASIRDSLKKGNPALPGMVLFAGEISFPKIGNRSVALLNIPPLGDERGVIFTSIVTEDFLTPPATLWVRTENRPGAVNRFVQDDSLPGVGEGLVRIETLRPDEHAQDSNLPEIRWGGSMGDLHLLIHPGPKFARDSLADEAWIVLGGGSLVALLLAVLAWTQARQRGLLRDQVRSQTSELREANATLGSYKAILETTSDFVGLCELDGTPIFMNQSGRAMLGIGPDESLLAYPLDRIYPTETLELFAREGIPHAMEHGSWAAEINMLHRDDHQIPASFVGVVIQSSDGMSHNLGFIARDITASRALDSQLRDALENQRELVRLKSQFVNTISHEFRTPLGVILSSTDILTHYLGRLSPENRRQHLDDIFNSCKHMSRMLEQVLNLGCIEAGNEMCSPRPLNLASFLSRIADESASANRGGKIHLTTERNVGNVWGDEALLRHIFLNLLSNARKYSPPEALVEFSVRREANDAIFNVRDQGIGIPAADLPHLFETFSRGSNVQDVPGTGLGLAIVLRCTQLHGGTVHFESVEGQGTLVTVRLPLFQAPTP